MVRLIPAVHDGRLANGTDASAEDSKHSRTDPEVESLVLVVLSLWKDELFESPWKDD